MIRWMLVLVSLLALSSSCIAQEPMCDPVVQCDEIPLGERLQLQQEISDTKWWIVFRNFEYVCLQQNITECTADLNVWVAFRGVLIASGRDTQSVDEGISMRRQRLADLNTQQCDVLWHVGKLHIKLNELQARLGAL